MYHDRYLIYEMVDHYVRINFVMKNLSLEGVVEDVYRDILDNNIIVILGKIDSETGKIVSREEHAISEPSLVLKDKDKIVLLYGKMEDYKLDKEINRVEIEINYEYSKKDLRKRKKGETLF